MKTIRRLLYLLGIIYIPVLVNAQSIKTTVITSSTSSLELNVKLTNYTNSQTGALILNSSLAKMEIGKPDLPSKSEWILLPGANTPVITVTTGTAVEFSNVTIEPLQPPASEADEDVPYTKDNTVYSTNAFYPGSFASIEPVKKLQGQNYSTVWIYPYQYNPVTKILKVYPDMTVKISFGGSSEEISAESVRKLNSSILGTIAINSAAILSESEVTPSPETANGCDLLIITHANFLQAANKLAAWKNSIGIPTTVVTTSQIGTSPTNTVIEQYVNNAVNNWVPSPSYLILMGDAEYIPVFYITTHSYHGTKIGTDVYYADLDNVLDGLTDLAFGRIPVNTLTEANNMVDRIIRHERNPQSAQFFNNIACAAYFQPNGSYEDRRFTKTSEDMRNSFLSHGFNAQRIYVTESSISPLYWSKNSNYIFENDASGASIPNELKKPGFPWTGNATDISNAVNNGIFLLTHRDHGAREGWGDPYYTSTHVDNLTNGERRPVVWSINCQTGWFDNETDQEGASTTTECFAEHWVTHTTGGSTGVIAATRVSYSGYNDRLVWGFMDAIWPGFIRSNGGNYGSSANTPILRMGDVLNYGKAYMTSMFANNSYRLYTNEIFHWFGDPTMRLFPEACIPNLTVDNDIIASGQTMNFTASDRINIAGLGNLFTVNSGGNATYRAGSSIVFKTGFSAKSGSLMRAYLQQCSGENLYKSAPAENITEFSSEKSIGTEPENNPDNPGIVNIFPNPAKDKLYVTGFKDFEAIIYDIYGKKLLHIGKVQDNSIDVSGLVSGSYIIYLKVADQTHIQKVTVVQ